MCKQVIFIDSQSMGIAKDINGSIGTISRYFKNTDMFEITMSDGVHWYGSPEDLLQGYLKEQNA